MRKAILALLLLIAMFVAACSTTTTNNGSTGFIGGVKGLDIAFYANAPPASTPDNKQQEFDVIVDITNGGEYAVAIEDVYVKLSGFPPESFDQTIATLKKSPPEKIDANIKNPDGTVIAPPVVSVTFPGFNYQDVEVASRTFPIRADICYEYETQAAAELCVKENFNSNKVDDLCQVNADRSLSTSGGPVQITSLKQSTAGADKTRFTFTVQNMDNGEIYKSDSECERITSNENKVFVSVSDLGASTIDSVKCVGLSGGTSNAGYITLVPGQARDVSCTVTYVNRNNRIQPFNIKLAYAYFKFVDTSILIEHSPE
ncbi:MAG: hypothetical protein WC758_04015 [Candidatus Woesearchaeota archaeon]|jgi:hypothetical protein